MFLAITRARPRASSGLADHLRAAVTLRPRRADARARAPEPSCISSGRSRPRMPSVDASEALPRIASSRLRILLVRVLSRNLDCAAGVCSEASPASRSSACSRPIHPVSTICRIERPADVGIGIRGTFALAVLVVLGLLVPLSAGAANDGATMIQVRSSSQFEGAVRALRRHGRDDQAPPQRLRRRVRRSGRVPPGRCGSSASREFGSRACSSSGPRHVSVSRVTIAPMGDDAWLRVSGSRHVDVDDVLVTAKGTRYRATLQVIESRHVGDPGKRVPPLRRPLTALFQLPASQARHEAHPHHPQLVPRLSRLRFRPRPLRLRPDAPREPLRACAALPHGPRALQAPGPGVLLVGEPAARGRQLVRRLPARRRAALPHPRSGQGLHRQQRVSRHRPQGARLPCARRDHCR